MKKVLFLSNTANFSKFNRPYMRWFKQQGWQVDYCSAGEETVLDCDNQYSISIARSPFSLKNLRALKELKKLLSENHYDGSWVDDWRKNVTEFQYSFIQKHGDTKFARAVVALYHIKKAFQSLGFCRGMSYCMEKIKK